MDTTAKYKLNGIYYGVKKIDEANGIIYLIVNHESFPVRLSDVENIG